MRVFTILPLLALPILAGCSEKTTMSAEDGVRPPTIQEAQRAMKASLLVDDDEISKVEIYKINTTTKVTGELEYYICANADRPARFTTYDYYTNEILTRPEDTITDRYFALVFYDIPAAMFYTGNTRIVRKDTNFAGVPTLELCGP